MTAASGYSTRELQAAATALAAGRFAENGMVRRCRRAATWHPQCPVVRVLPAHAGAGASTIALALADAAAQSAAVRLVDAAAPDWSGLVGASVTELGADDGWRHGRRSPRLVIDRLDQRVATPGEVPVPPDHADPVALTVLDVGWTPRELHAHPDGWLTTTAAVDVVVTRASVPAFGQTEFTLAGTDLRDCALVVVGTNRWSGPEFASAGHRMRQLRESGSVSFLPLLPARTLSGLGPDPLPKALMSPIRRLLEQLAHRADHAADATRREQP